MTLGKVPLIRRVPLFNGYANRQAQSMLLRRKPMPVMAKLIFLSPLALLSGCQLIMCSTMINCFDPLGTPPVSPYIAHVQVTTPNYMDAHLHTIEQDFTYGREISYSNSVLKMRAPGKAADGWTPPELLQSMPDILKFRGLDELPNKLTVKWTSLAENKAYRASIKLHLGSRINIHKKIETTCIRSGKPMLGRRNIITLEITPGGRVKSWLSGVCLDAIEIATTQGHLIPQEGIYIPYDAFENYDSAPMRNYIRANGIPYESWQ